MKIRFGIYDDPIPPIGTVKTTSMYPINSRDFLATTVKGFYRFCDREIKEFYNFKCSTSVLIPEIEAVVGLEMNTNNFIGFQLYSMEKGQLILKGCDAKHIGVFHMIYSPKSHVILTVGNGVKSWNLTSTRWNNRTTALAPKLDISLRSSFVPNYQTSILNPPVFDYDTECILLPTENGLKPFDIDGNMHNCVSRYPTVSIDTNMKTVPAPVRSIVYSMYKKNNEKGKKTYLTSDSENGLCVWSNQKLKKRISTTGNIILMMHCIDQENVIYMDSRGTLYLLNTKTERSFPCYVLSKLPNMIFVSKNAGGIKITCTMDMSIQMLHIENPWEAWALNVKQAHAILRCPKLNDAARILVITDNSFVKIYSPLDGGQLTAATPKSTSQPLTALYDRGILVDDVNEKEYQMTAEGGLRDQLFSALENGYLVSFNTGVQPAEEVFSVDLRARFICRVKYDDLWEYAICGKDSDFFIYDYNTLKSKKRCSVRKEPILAFYYHQKSGLVVILYQCCIDLYDLQRSTVIATLQINCTNVSALHGDDLFIGYKTGHLGKVKIVDRSIINPDPDVKKRPHMDAITNFSFASAFWMSCSLDKSVQLWDYNMMGILRIELPIPIFAVAALNGKRDILVATDNEIMKIDGSLIFDEVDKEIPEMDNFDKIRDLMNPSTIIAPEEEQEEEESESLLKNPPKDVKEPPKAQSHGFFSFKRSNWGEAENNDTTKSPLNENSNKQNDGEDVDDEEKQRLLEEMNAMTIADPPAFVPQPPPEKEESNEMKQKEEEEAKEEEENEGETKKKTKKKEKKEISANELLKNTIAEEEELKNRPKKKKKHRVKHEEVKQEEEEDIAGLYDYFNKDEKLEEIKPRAKRERKVYEVVLPKVIKEELEPQVKEPKQKPPPKPKKEPSSPIRPKPKPIKRRDVSPKDIQDFDEDDESTETEKEKEKEKEENVAAAEAKKKRPMRKSTVSLSADANKKKEQQRNHKSSKLHKKQHESKNKNEDEDENENEDENSNEEDASNKSADNESSVDDEESESENLNEDKNNSLLKSDDSSSKGDSVISNKSEKEENKKTNAETNTESINNAPKRRPNPVPPINESLLNSSPRRIKQPPQSARPSPNKTFSNQFMNKQNTKKKTIDQIDPQLGHLLGITDHYPAYLKNRAPTPPPIRWGNQLISQRLFSPNNKARDQPKKRIFRMPPPNIVIDPNAVLSEYGKGWEDLKPLVDKLLNEKDFRKICPFYSGKFDLKAEYRDIMSRKSSKKQTHEEEKQKHDDDFQFLYEDTPTSSLLVEAEEERQEPQLMFRHSARRERQEQEEKEAEIIKLRSMLNDDRYMPFWTKVVELGFASDKVSPEAMQIQEILTQRKKEIQEKEKERERERNKNPFTVKRIVMTPRETMKYIETKADDDLRRFISERRESREKEYFFMNGSYYERQRTAFPMQQRRIYSFDQLPSTQQSQRRSYNRSQPLVQQSPRPTWLTFLHSKRGSQRRDTFQLDSAIKITRIPLVKPRLH